MPITIDDKPDRPVCSIHGALRWGWFTDTRQGARWVSFTLEQLGDHTALVPHVCDDPDPTPVRWAPSPEVAERARRGRAYADEILAAKAKSSIEKEEQADDR